jgi:hypothetical protein
MIWDLSALLSIWEEGVLQIFITLKKKSVALAGFEPAIFGSSGKHTNHYTTAVTGVLELKWGYRIGHKMAAVLGTLYDST